jgi:hypothetical protein
MKATRIRLISWMTDETEVLSVFLASQTGTISTSTYGARRVCVVEEKKNEISIDYYLLNNTLLAFLAFLPLSPSLSLPLPLYASLMVTRS